MNFCADRSCYSHKKRHGRNSFHRRHGLSLTTTVQDASPTSAPSPATFHPPSPPHSPHPCPPLPLLISLYLPFPPHLLAAAAFPWSGGVRVLLPRSFPSPAALPPPVCPPLPRLPTRPSRGLYGPRLAVRGGRGGRHARSGLTRRVCGARTSAASGGGSGGDVDGGGDVCRAAAAAVDGCLNDWRGGTRATGTSVRWARRWRCVVFLPGRPPAMAALGGGRPVLPLLLTAASRPPPVPLPAAGRSRPWTRNHERRAWRRAPPPHRVGGLGGEAH